jgi:hypothetical protein
VRKPASLSSDAKCNTPRRFDIGKVVQDLKECCHAILFAKRLARLLLLLAHFGKEGKPEPIIANINQETLAEMIGTTQSRVSSP